MFVHRAFHAKYNLLRSVGSVLVHATLELYSHINLGQQSTDLQLEARHLVLMASFSPRRGAAPSAKQDAA